MNQLQTVHFDKVIMSTKIDSYLLCTCRSQVPQN